MNGKKGGCKLQIIKTILYRIFSLFMIMFLMGCSNSDDLEITYTKGVVSFCEYDNRNWYNNSKELGTCAVAENVTYYFAAELEQEKVESYIRQTNAIIEKIEDEAGIEGENYEIYVCNVEYVPTTKEKILYTSYLDFETLDYVSGITQLVLGNHINYGLIYGYSASIADDLGYDISRMDLKEAFVVRQGHPQYLDLNYACFLEHFVAAEDIGKLKEIAVSYYEYLENEKCTDVLFDYTNEKHRNAFNDFLKVSGEKDYNNPEMDVLTFRSGGNSQTVVWEDPYSVFYMEKDFTVKALRPYEKEDMLNSGYENLRKLALIYVDEGNWISEKVLSYEREIVKVDTFFTKDEYYRNLTHYGTYDYTNNQIRVYRYDSYLHEYVHALFLENKRGDWQQECIAYYFGTHHENPTGYEISLRSLEDEFLKENTELNPVSTAFIQNVERRLGHVVEYSVQEDFMYKSNANAVFRNKLDDLKVELGGVEKLAFTQYLVSIYGEEVVINALMKDDANTYLGMDWDFLIEQWEEYLNTEFSWVLESN